MNASAIALVGDDQARAKRKRTMRSNVRGRRGVVACNHRLGPDCEGHAGNKTGKGEAESHSSSPCGVGVRSALSWGPHPSRPSPPRGTVMRTAIAGTTFLDATSWGLKANLSVSRLSHHE